MQFLGVNLLVLPLRMGDVYSGLRDDMPAFDDCQQGFASRLEHVARVSGVFY